MAKQQTTRWRKTNYRLSTKQSYINHLQVEIYLAI